MPIPLIALAVVGLTGAVVAGLVAGNTMRSEPIQEDNLPQTSESTPLFTPEPTATPSPSHTPGLFENWDPPLLDQDWRSQIIPSPAVRTHPSPSPTSLASPAAPTPTEEAISPLGIEFISLPQTVKAGQQFIVRWRVAGPSDATGQSTNLTVLYEASSAEGGSEASARSKSSQSFGSFTVPAEFEATFSFGSMPADVQVTATAEVGGNTIEEHRTVQLVP